MVIQCSHPYNSVRLGRTRPVARAVFASGVRVVRSVIVMSGSTMALQPSAGDRWLWVALAGALLLGSTVGAERPMPPTADDSSHEFVNTYCVTCHNDKAKTGDVSLPMVDFAAVGPHAGLLEPVRRQVRSGEMPPAGRPRPDASAIASFTIDLERSLDEFAAAHPNPGR